MNDEDRFEYEVMSELLHLLDSDPDYQKWLDQLEKEDGQDDDLEQGKTAA